MIDLTQPIVPAGPRPQMPFWRRVFIFCAVTTCCFLCASLLIAILGKINSNTGGLRLVVITQDVVMFIAPALATAAMIVGPQRMFGWIGMNRMPGLRICMLALMAYFVSIPLMEWIVDWNAGIQLPQWLAGVETTMRSFEDAANDTVNSIVGAHTVGNLIVSIIIIGIITGIAEETFFRGGLQRVLYRPGHRQVAVWIAALVFSFMHFQFYGFVPRLLLGALFGYVFLWSGSLWTGIILHALNNTLTLCQWWSRGAESVAGDGVGFSLTSPLMVGASVVLTAVTLYLMWASRVKINHTSENPS